MVPGELRHCVVENPGLFADLKCLPVVQKLLYIYSLFMCPDEDENEDEHQSFGSFWNLCMMNKPILQCIIVLRAWFVRHRLYPEQTKTFVFRFVFVFVLAHEQPIILNHIHRVPLNILFWCYNNKIPTVQISLPALLISQHKSYDNFG